MSSKSEIPMALVVMAVGPTGIPMITAKHNLRICYADNRVRQDVVGINRLKEIHLRW